MDRLGQNTRLISATANQGILAKDVRLLLVNTFFLITIAQTQAQSAHSLSYWRTHNIFSLKFSKQIQTIFQNVLCKLYHLSSDRGELNE